MNKTVEVDVSDGVRTDTKGGLAIIVRRIPLEQRRGVTTYRLKDVVDRDGVRTAVVIMSRDGD